MEPQVKIPLQRTVYTGTFLHTPSLGELVVLENASIGVDEHGIIAFVAKTSEELQTELHTKGWDDPVDVAGKQDGTGWFFPGFLGRGNHDFIRLIALVALYSHYLSYLTAFLQIFDILYNKSSTAGIGSEGWYWNIWTCCFCILSCTCILTYHSTAGNGHPS